MLLGAVVLVGCGSADSWDPTPAETGGDSHALPASGGATDGAGGSVSGGVGGTADGDGGTGGGSPVGPRCDHIPACAAVLGPCELEYTVTCGDYGWGWFTCGFEHEERRGYSFEDGQVFDCPVDGGCESAVQLASDYCSELGKTASGGSGGTGGTGGTGGAGGGSGGTGGAGWGPEGQTCAPFSQAECRDSHCGDHGLTERYLFGCDGGPSNPPAGCSLSPNQNAANMTVWCCASACQPTTHLAGTSTHPYGYRCVTDHVPDVSGCVPSDSYPHQILNCEAPVSIPSGQACELPPDVCRPPSLQPYPAPHTGTYSVTLGRDCGWVDGDATTGTAPTSYYPAWSPWKEWSCGEASEGFFQGMTSEANGQVTLADGRVRVGVLAKEESCGAAPMWGKHRVYQVHASVCAKITTPFNVDVQSRRAPLDGSNPHWGIEKHPVGALLDSKNELRPGGGGVRDRCWVLGITDAPVNNQLRRLQMGVTMAEDGWVHVSADWMTGGTCPLSCD